MNRIQMLLLGIFLPLTILFLILDNFYPGAPFVNYIKFASTTTLLLVSVIIRKRYPEQRLMAKSMFFVMTGDFFLVLCSTYFESSGRVVPFGVISFAIAYLLLIAAFQKNIKMGWREIAAAVPVLVLSIPVIVKLLPFVGGLMRYGLLLFTFILCYASWTCLCTVFRGYFTRKNAYIIALAGFLMLICDLAVGVSLFHPDYNQHFVPWIKNIIWGAYVPAWTLIVITIAETNLISQETPTHH